VTVSVEQFQVDINFIICLRLTYHFQYEHSKVLSCRFQTWANQTVQICEKTKRSYWCFTDL